MTWPHYLVLITITLMSTFSLRGQISSNSVIQDKDYKVVWINNIPDINQDKKTSFLQILERIVLGERPEKIVKPVMAFPSGIDNFWILCQETGTILNYKNRRFYHPRGKKRGQGFFPSLISGCSLDNSDIVFTDSSKDMIYLLNEDGEITDFYNDTTLSRPTGIAYSTVENEVWVVESGAHRISILSREGHLIRHIGRRGTETGEFNYPTHIWIDAEGVAYVVDAMNFRVQIFDNQGEYIGSFGEAGNATGKFARPKGIATDSHGNIYVADALFNTIQIFDRQGNLLYYFGGQGSENGELMMPAGIYIDDNDYIYVSDSFNNRIQVFQLINRNK